MPKFPHTLFQLSCWTGFLLQQIFLSRQRRQNTEDLRKDIKTLRSDIHNRSREFDQGIHMVEKCRDRNEECECAGQWLQEWVAEMQKREEYMAIRGVRAGYKYCMAYAIKCQDPVDTNS
jgi:hypothetical protein